MWVRPLWFSSLHIFRLAETGHITFEEYVKQASKLDSDPVEAEDRLRASFRLFDPLGTGVINAEILRGILTQTGDVFTQDEVDEMLADANVDTSGVINYEGASGRRMCVGARRCMCECVSLCGSWDYHNVKKKRLTRK